VFVVGYLGDWRRAAAVLFEPHSLRGDAPPSRAKGEGVAVSVIKGAAIGRKPHNGPQYGEILEDGTCYTLNCVDQHAVSIANPLGAKKDGGWRGDLDNDTFVPSVSLCLNAHPNRIDGESETFIAHTLRGEGFDASEDGTGRGTPLVPIAFGHQNSHHQGDSVSADITPALDKSKTPAVQYGAAVRRLTPRECLRLQGFPDDHLDVLWRGKPLADGPRYRMIGNSMAVPVMSWIGRRIEQQEKHFAGFLPA